MKKLLMLGCLMFAGAAFAQQPPSLVGNAKAGWDRLNDLILKSAQKMPDENWGFKPVADVRSFGEIVGHVVETNYGACARLKGETANPAQGAEKKSKADLVKMMGDMKAFCAPVFEGLTPDKTIKIGNREIIVVAQIFGLNAHTNEHYGNLVTYMRIKGIVPPSSER